MSGGVDSSVSAALLKEQGYDVTGIFIKVWQADFLPCTWREERRDAMRVAAHLDIPFLTLDLEKEYKKEVVDYMIHEYGAGRVPNPDVMCNKHVKFGAFLDFAKKQGADFVATGHYARNEKQHDGRFHLLAGLDKEKDQSYFLWMLTQTELAHVLFPVGRLQKSEVRFLAKKFGLPNAEKRDSQGLCFMGKIDMAEFLKHYLKTKKGDVIDFTGNVIGTHEGSAIYTIGQRHGFVVEKNSPDMRPYFVVAKDMHNNTITVAHHMSGETKEAASITLEDCNAISKELADVAEKKCAVRMRYRGKLIAATWKNMGAPDDRQAEVLFENGEGEVALGQSVVAYQGDECLGGGVVSASP